MKRKLSSKGLMGALMTAALLFGLGASARPFANVKPWINGLLFAVGFLIAAFMPTAAHANGVAMNGISREVWEAYVVENLYQDNEFLMAWTDESEYVTFKTVHRPQAGGNPVVQKNRALGGAATNTNLRTDITVDYSIDEYTTDPFLITNAEEVELSYSKMDSVLSQHQSTLRQTIANNILVSVAPTGTAVAVDGVTVNHNILRTSGVPFNNLNAAVTSSPAYTKSAIGNRLNFTTYDVLQAQLYLDNQDVPAGDRYMLLSASAYQQLLLDLTTTQFRDFSSALDPKTGVIGNLYGFKFFKRSSVFTYTNDAIPVVKPVGAGGAATDNDAVLFWQKGALSKSVGDTHIFETPNSAVNYGDVYSVLQRMGGSKIRTNEVGYGAIVQNAAA